MRELKGYAARLADPLWQRRRLEIFNRDNWTCQGCGDKTTQLEVHHVEYWEGRKPWQYDNDSLITVCNGCHQKEEARPKHEKYLLRSLKSMGFLASDILALSSLITQPQFKEFLLKKIRQYANS